MNCSGDRRPASWSRQTTKLQHIQTFHTVEEKTTVVSQAVGKSTAPDGLRPVAPELRPELKLFFVIDERGPVHRGWLARTLSGSEIREGRIIWDPGPRS